MIHKKSIAISLALLFLCTVFAACSNPSGDKPPDSGDNPETHSQNDESEPLPATTSAIPYDTEGLLTAPVSVGEGADLLSDDELISIYQQLYPQAIDAYRCAWFETEQGESFEGDEGKLYAAVTNIPSTSEAIRNYESIFSYYSCTQQ